MFTPLTTSQLKRITVYRSRISATQGFAVIMVDGKPVKHPHYADQDLCFGDEPILHNDGKWYSDSSDISFVKAALHHKYEHIYHIRAAIIKALQA